VGGAKSYVGEFTLVYFGCAVYGWNSLGEEDEMKFAFRRMRENKKRWLTTTPSTASEIRGAGGGN
jgi:hypothetical protein